MSAPPKRSAVAYARVSSVEQLREGFSIPAQWKMLHDYAAMNAIQIEKEFCDDETAKAAGRSGFGQMLDYLRRHRDVAILVEKTDRLYRNPDDYLVVERLGVSIYFAKEGGLNPTNSDGRFMHWLRVGMARKYVENLSEEVKKGMRQKAAEGGWPTWAPLGYRNVKDPVEKKSTGGIVPDPAKAPLIVEIFEAAATGRYSYADLTRLADRIGLRGKRGTKITKPTMVYILGNTAYAGEFTWSGVTYRGRYEPLIPRELYDAAQRGLRAQSRPKPGRHVFAYGGIVRCGTCGGLLTGNRKKGIYIYYCCRGTKSCRRYYEESTFDWYVDHVLRSLAVDQATSAWIIGEMGAWYDAIAGKEGSAVARAEGRLSEIRNLEAASYEEKLLGRVDEQTWRALNEKWRVEASTLQAQIAAGRPTMSREKFLALMGAPLELAQDAAAQYLRQGAEDRARLLRIICQNFTVTGGTVSVSMRSPFDIMLECGDRTDWLGRMDDFRTGILALAA